MTNILESERKELLKHGYDFAPTTSYTIEEYLEAREEIWKRKIKKAENNLIRIHKPMKETLNRKG